LISDFGTPMLEALETARTTRDNGPCSVHQAGTSIHRGIRTDLGRCRTFADEAGNRPVDTEGGHERAAGLNEQHKPVFEGR